MEEIKRISRCGMARVGENLSPVVGQEIALLTGKDPAEIPRTRRARPSRE